MSTVASRMLDCVETWCGSPGDYLLIRETSACVDDGGRLDGLLLPLTMQSDPFKKRGRERRDDGLYRHWTERLVLVGIEVKASRADFLRGLKEGQFERYTNKVAGLYVVTGREVKTAEVPGGLGHLVCYRPEGELQQNQWGHRWRTPPEQRCVCKRHPNYRDPVMDEDTMWRVIREVIRRWHEDQRAMRKERDEVFERVGEVASRRLAAMLRADATGIRA